MKQLTTEVKGMRRMVRSGAMLVMGFLMLQGCSDPLSTEGGDTATASALAAIDGPVAAKRAVAAGQQTATIVDVALSVNAESGEFSVLIDALQRADLVGALNARRQLTVFAPTDAAFVALLGELGATSLDDIDAETLTAVLLYHVTPGRRLSASVLNQERINTLNGGFIYKDEGSATLTDERGRKANILVGAGLYDIPASNGVIHVIDRVLLP